MPENMLAGRRRLPASVCKRHVLFRRHSVNRTTAGIDSILQAPAVQKLKMIKNMRKKLKMKNYKTVWNDTCFA
jgi:hypothetical protein